jgi:hypothetical protein
LLIIAQVYYLGKLLSNIDAELFFKYRFFGPFALLFRGVLKRGGARFLIFFLCSAALVFAFGLYLFEFYELPSPTFH